MTDSVPASPVDEQPPPKVDCPKCLEKPSKPELPSRAVPNLKSWTEVLEVLGVTQAIKSDHTHSISALLALYELVPMVECALPDRTHHHWGFAVRTTCGLHLNIGHECGRRRIPDMRGLLNADIEHRRHEERVAKVRTAEDDCARAERLRSEVVSMVFFVDNMRAHAPSLAHELRQIARGVSDASTETNRRRGNDNKWVSDTHAVVGTQLFDEKQHPDTENMRSQIDYVREVCKEAGAEPTDRDARRACRQIDALREIMREAESWAGQARRFFSERNFAEALLVTQNADVQVKGEKFITPDHYEIGIGGPHRIT